MNIIFMGTPEFSLNCLTNLINSKHNVIAVYTQPDKPKGRKYKLTPPPVKELACENSIPVYQPESLRNTDTIEEIKNFNPELIVVVAYGKILPEEVLNIPKYGCVNVHASLLPKYRGAAPIQWSVINGEEKTGVTTMLMDKGLDTGDMLLKKEVIIRENETASELHDRLSVVGAELLMETITGIENNDITRQKQNDKESCYSPMIFKKDSKIDWSKNASTLHNFIRGMNSWPVASTKLAGKTLKIYVSSKSNKRVSDDAKLGEILSLEPFIVSCGENSCIELVEVQLEGKKRMKISDFLKGHRVNIGTILGE